MNTVDNRQDCCVGLVNSIKGVKSDDNMVTLKIGNEEFDPKEWGTMRECATSLKVSRQRVHQMIHEGKLGDCKKVTMPAGANDGGIWLIPKPFEVNRKRS